MARWKSSEIPLLVVFTMSACLLGRVGPVHSAGPFGPPQPIVDEDRYSSLGLGYFWNEVEWESDKPSQFPPITVGQNIAFLYGGYAAGETSELYLRLGIADLTETDPGSFDGGYAGYGSLGLKTLWYGHPRSKYSVGTILQGSYHREYEQNRIPLSIGGTANVTIEQYWDVSLALGAQWRFSRKLIAYGGPFGYYSQAKATLDSTLLGLSTTTYEPKQKYGLHAGARYEPFRHWFIEAEIQFQGNICGGVTLAHTLSD